MPTSPEVGNVIRPGMDASIPSGFRHPWYSTIPFVIIPSSLAHSTVPTVFPAKAGIHVTPNPQGQQVASSPRVTTEVGYAHSTHTEVSAWS